jgi:uncharacterized linocin/CFP29 family protein
MKNQIADTITSSGGGGMSGSGAVAARLLASGFDIKALRPCVDAGPQSMRANAVLRKDEWILFDRTVQDIARKRLIAVGDLLSRGLRTPIANALGITRVEWQRMGDMSAAEISMSGISESEYDRLTFDVQGLPVPIIHKDFTINVRALESSRRGGQPLDTLQVEVATRKVVEQIESMLFNGATVLGTNNVIYGYLTAPNRNTGSVTASWNTATGDQIVGDVLAMLAKAYADNMFGPFVLYTSINASVNMADDYKAESDRTILDRVLAIPGIEAIRPTAELTGNNVLLVQLSRDVVDMLDGIQPTTVEWESHGGFVVHFKVLAIMIPRIRNDYLNQSGIVHYS